MAAKKTRTTRLVAVNNKQAGQQRAQTDALFASIGDGAITTDENGKINRINQVALDILGFQAEEILGEWFPKVVVALTEKGKPISNINRPIMRSLLSGQPISERTYYRRKDGSTLPVFITVSPILQDGKPIGSVEVFRDISLELEADRMKSEFIAIASHQLRTPLSAIKLYCHMLSQGFADPLTDTQKELMEPILFSIDRMTELITTLLNITRIEGGQITVTPEETDLKAFAEQIVHEHEPAAQEKNLTITFTSTLKSVVLATDKVLTKEIMSNLVSNAIKYTPPGGKIKTVLSSSKNMLVFSVADSGYGIPENQQDRVFSKFFRANNILQKETVGTGLGLYLVKLIADALKGEVWFESREGKGSTFYFSIPKKGTKATAGTTTIDLTSPVSM